MKIFFISHACISQSYQEKLEKLAGYDDVKLFLITSYWWEEESRKITAAVKNNRNFTVIPMRAVFTGRQFIHFYPDLAALLKKIDPDIIHIEEEPNSAVCFQALWLKNVLKLKSKVVIFTWQNMFQRWYFPNPRFLFYPFFEKYSLRNSDHIIAGNNDGRDVLLKKSFRGGIDVMPQFGVDPDEFKKLDTAGLRKDLGLNGFVIGYLGRLLKMKGLYTLLKAASGLGEGCQLLIIGDGPEGNALKKEAERLGFGKRAIFVNSVNHQRVPEYLNCMDILTLPSEHTANWREQFGRVLVEAMACEVPVVGSDCGEIPNVIKDGGLVFREGDSEDLKNKLKTLIADEGLRSKFIKTARRRVLDNYTTDKIARRTYDIYGALLSGTTQGRGKYWGPKNAGSI